MEIFVENPILAYLFIFFARVADVSLDVFRLLLLTRGYSVPAAIVGFFEVSIFVVALGTVFSGGVTDIFKIIAYAAGFASGNLVGMQIEKMTAFGYVVIQMFPTKEDGERLGNLLRENNFGLTTIAGEGKWGPRDILVVTVKRKDLPRVLKIMSQVAPDIFYNTSDIRSIHGGIFPRRKL
ncbi:MAG: DUF2179 domain-containing protein [Bacillota bacterium]